MMPTPPALAYRRAATQQASLVGLVIALYDTLAGDLRRAATAMDQGDIEERSRQLKHGFCVLTQLDSLINMEQGGETALNLRRFYGYLRQEMLDAQFQQSSFLLERAATRLVEVREAWQTVDSQQPGPPTANEASAVPAAGAVGTGFPIDCQA